MTAMPVTTGSRNGQFRNAKIDGLLRSDVAGVRKTLDTFLDVEQCIQGGLDRSDRHALQHVGCISVAQAVEIVDELAASIGQEQTVCATILGVMTTLDQTVLEQPVKQPHQRDRLQLKPIGS